MSTKPSAVRDDAVSVRIVVVAGTDVVAADQDAADVPGATSAPAASAMRTSQCGDRLADAHELDGVVARRPARTASPGPSACARQRVDGKGRAGLRKRHGQARLGEAVDRKHHVRWEPRRRERREEVAAQVGGDRLGAIEDDAHA